MWELFDPAMRARRPVLVAHEDPATGRPSNRWLIDGGLVPHPPGKGGQGLQTPPADPQAREKHAWTTKALIDVSARLEDADQMGVDTQVVFPTLFIAHLTFDAELDVALSQAYNRYLARAWETGGGRLRWVAVLPFNDISASIAQLNWAREHGAVGFNARGIEGERSLAEP
jgi:hypothetical protein